MTRSPAIPPAGNDKVPGRNERDTSIREDGSFFFELGEGEDGKFF